MQLQVQRTVLSTEPDLDFAVLNGDQVTAFYWQSNLSSGWYESHWRHLAQPVLDSGLPFAVNLGNHDGEADLTRRQVVQLAMRTSERSYTKVSEEALPGKEVAACALLPCKWCVFGRRACHAAEVADMVNLPLLPCGAPCMMPPLRPHLAAVGARGPDGRLQLLCRCVQPGRPGGGGTSVGPGQRKHGLRGAERLVVSAGAEAGRCTI